MSTSTKTLSKTDPTSLVDGITAVGVARQSSTRDDSMSVAEQEAAMRAECERRGWHLKTVYIEKDVSGRRSLDKRPGLKPALEDVERGRAQILLTAYFDRFVRSLKTQHEVVDRVEAAGGQVHTMDLGTISNGTAAQWLSSSMLGMVSEYYSRSSAERVAASKAANIAKGVPPFPRITAAYVRRADGTLEQHPTNGPLIAEACRMRASGKSYLAIQRYLAEHGLKLTPTGVETTLGSKLLIGEIHFGNFKPNLRAIDVGEVVIDRATFRAMHKAKATRGRHAKSEQLLARLGVLRCETCDAKMSVHSAGRKGGTQYAYYRCGNRLCPKPALVSCKAADEAVRDEVFKLGRKVSGHASAAADVEVARVNAADAQAKLDRAFRTFLGLDDEEAAREVLDELTVERDEAVAEHARLATLSSADLTVTTTADWKRLTLAEQRAAIVAVIARAVVAPGRGPDRVVVSGRTLLGK